MEIVEKEQPLGFDNYAWRYISFENLKKMLLNNQIYFKRIDQYEDPNEGLSAQLRWRMYLKTIIIEAEKDSSLKKIAEDPIYQSEINRYQKGSFASCWFIPKKINDLDNNNQGHNESLAMWQFYGKADGIALKIKYETLKEIITKSVESIIDQEFVEMHYGMVNYLSIYDHMMLNNEIDTFPGFIKDASYFHENECRFLLYRKNTIITPDRIQFNLPLYKPLKEFQDDIEIYANPKMNVSSFNKCQDEIISLGIHKFLKSKIPTKENIQQFIVNDNS